MLEFLKTISVLILLICSCFSVAFGEVQCDSIESRFSNSTLAEIDSLIDQCMNHRMDVEGSLEEYGKRIICFSKAQHDLERLCSGNFILGTHYYFVSKTDLALEYLYKAKSISLDSGQDWILAHSANFLGLTYRVLGHFDLALSFQQEFYDYGVEKGIIHIQGSALLNLGGIYQDAGELEKSLDSQLRALKLFEKDIPAGRIREEQLWLHLSIGVNRQKLSENEDAIYHFEKAMEIAEKLNFTRGMLWTMVNVINFYVDFDLPKAESYLASARELLQEFQDTHIECALVYESARIDFKKGLVKEPIAALEGIQKIVIDNGLKSMEFKVFDLLIEILRENNLTDTELKQLRSHQQRFKDYVADFKINSLTVWAENQKLFLDHQKENLELKKAEFERNKAFRTLRAIFVAALLVLLALMIYLSSARKLNKRTAEHNRILQEKNENIAMQLGVIGNQKEELEKAKKIIEEERSKLKNDLAQKMIHIANEQEMLSNLSKILDDIDISRLGKQKIKNYLNRHNRETIWEEFDHELSSSNELFFAKLAGLSAKLTSNDLRLAALIKMNLTNKEIARLLFRSVESIHMAKSRMRKKLAIDAGEMNLTAYFNYIMKEGIEDVDTDN